MSDHLAGMARIIRAAPHDPDDVCISVEEAMTGHGCQARAAWAYALAALRVTSPAREQARLAAWRDTRPYKRASDWLASVVEADLRAFELEHGLEAPAAGGRQAVGELIERLSRKAHPDSWAELDRAKDRGWTAAEAADEVAAAMLAGDERVVLAVLAALREPSEAMVAAYWGYPLPEHVSDGMRDEVRSNTTLVVDAFARENGLKQPDAAPPAGLQATTGDGTEADGPRAESATINIPTGFREATLPAYRTAGGRAATTTPVPGETEAMP